MYGLHPNMLRCNDRLSVSVVILVGFSRPPVMIPQYGRPLAEHAALIRHSRHAKNSRRMGAFFLQEMMEFGPAGAIVINMQRFDSRESFSDFRFQWEIV